MRQLKPRNRRCAEIGDIGGQENISRSLKLRAMIADPKADMAEAALSGITTAAMIKIAEVDCSGGDAVRLVADQIRS